MKRFYLLFGFVVSVMISQGQQNIQIAERIATRMKDTLSLTESQKQQIYNINLQLNENKMNVRSQFSNTDSLRRRIQAIENTRDSLYQAVLLEEKYLLYRIKKKNLVNNN